MKVNEFKQDQHNFNRGTEEGARLMNKSLKEFGAGRSILVDKDDNIIAGNKTALAALNAGIEDAIVVETTGDKLVVVKRTDIDIDSKQGRELALADNKTTEVNLAWDDVQLQQVGEEFGMDLEAWGVFKSPDEEAAEAEAKQQKKEEREVKKMKDRFILPPMSILDTRSALWQQRRNYWIDKTQIKSQEGRGENLCYTVTAQSTDFYEMKNAMRKELGREPTTEELVQRYKESGQYMFEGTSVFDPVICELMYRWYNVKDGKILDPFAGGSVRGIMAGELRMEYHGNDLREEQITENRRQAANNFDYNWTGPLPRWTFGDSCELDTILAEDGCGDMQFDLIFSCPPYADLEVYSDDPKDISNMNYDDFLVAYRKIISKACAKLKDNRFAVFVVSEVRGKDGRYYNFVGDTVKAFEDCGLKYYNELILVNQVGSKSITAVKGFMLSRKTGRHHQNVLVFAKGNPQEVNDQFENVDIKKGMKQFNEQRIISDRHNKILVFYKGDSDKNIRLSFENETPPDPSWEDLTIFSD